MKNNSGLYVELNKCYLKENNEQIKEIVNRYADKARMGKRATLAEMKRKTKNNLSCVL